MTIYIDGLFLLDFYFDFLILITVSLILKKNVKIYNLIIGSFVGSISLVLLFLKINIFQLLILKIYISLLMILFTFKYKNLNNLIYQVITFYFVSFLLGGFMYSLKKEINFIVLCIISPIILYLYIKQYKNLKNKKLYKVNIYINKKIIRLSGFLDTGNNLEYKNKIVIITNIKNTFKKKKYYIPYKVIDNYGLLECILIKKVEVIGLGTYNDVYLGFSNFDLPEDVLLNNKMEA